MAALSDDSNADFCLPVKLRDTLKSSQKNVIFYFVFFNIFWTIFFIFTCKSFFFQMHVLYDIKLESKNNSYLFLSNWWEDCCTLQNWCRLTIKPWSKSTLTFLSFYLSSVPGSGPLGTQLIYKLIKQPPAASPFSPLCHPLCLWTFYSSHLTDWCWTPPGPSTRGANDALLFLNMNSPIWYRHELSLL